MEMSTEPGSGTSMHLHKTSNMQNSRRDLIINNRHTTHLYCKRYKTNRSLQLLNTLRNFECESLNESYLHDSIYNVYNITSAYLTL